jgi:hypothetical protein
MEPSHPCMGCVYYQETKTDVAVKKWCKLYKCRPINRCYDFKGSKVYADQQQN